ncbi:type I restriction-modification enzyme R subunit [Escherichia coli]|uniref:Type I restriction-modification enzyme R subunit n=1 Tax=Escherichia coli TaxID=562 RepID=A0A2X1N4A7_ECOLX|nr:type I restriction-modification enzyme R subunit [Escherichia coli]
MTHQTHTIAESNNFIVLDKYIKAEPTGDSYQSESDLERELIQDLRNQGYEFISVKSQSGDAGQRSGTASEPQWCGV